MLSDIEKRLMEFVFTSNDGVLGAVHGDTELLRSGIVDSLKMVELITYLEESFSIHLGPEDLVESNLNSINNIVAFVRRQFTAAA